LVFFQKRTAFFPTPDAVVFWTCGRDGRYKAGDLRRDVMTQSAAPIMSAADYALARNLMVDGQLRPTNVTDRRILDAMRALPRESYVPSKLAPLAYIDQDLPLGAGRVMLKPLLLARLLQLAKPRAGETALIVGAGSLYGAAVLAACGVHVTALEEDAALLALAPQAPAQEGTIAVVEGKLADGYEASAPYDLVVIEGGVPSIPEAIGRQVAAGGRLVAVVMPQGVAGYAAIAEPTTGGLSSKPAFNASAPLLPGLAPAPGFSF
jgi:protein-L-isoaspartate(D-aspartate) O-methyltransferase